MSNTGQNKICLHFLQFYLDPESQIQTQELSSKQCRCTDCSSRVAAHVRSLEQVGVFCCPLESGDGRAHLNTPVLQYTACYTHSDCCLLLWQKLRWHEMSVNPLCQLLVSSKLLLCSQPMAVTVRSSKVTHHPKLSTYVSFPMTSRRWRWSASACLLGMCPTCWCSKPKTRCWTAAKGLSACCLYWPWSVCPGLLRDELWGCSLQHGGLLFHGDARHQTPAGLRSVLQPQGAQDR